VVQCLPTAVDGDGDDGFLVFTNGGDNTPLKCRDGIGVGSSA
jgi:hypothetical protein